MTASRQSKTPSATVTDAHVGSLQVMAGSRLLTVKLPASACEGLFGSRTQFVPLTRNLYWTGWSYGTGTDAYHLPA